MTPFSRPLFRAGIAALAALAVVPGSAVAANDFDQKPEIYICPNAGGAAIDCFLEAVSHLYTMCRQVKSIEIIEYGHAEAEKGVNAAKSEYCIDKHKASIKRHYLAALNAATKNRAAVETLRALHDYWQKSLVELKWHPGESDAEYQARVAKPYDIFRERADVVRTSLANPSSSAAAKSAAKPKPAAAKAAAATKQAN